MPRRHRFDINQQYCANSPAGLSVCQATRCFMAGPAERRQSVGVDVGGVMVGGGAPVVVQSMTNTDTADIDATVKQVMQLARAGSEIVRITVDRDESAAAVPIIRDRLSFMGYDVPLVGDFHYIGPSCSPIIPPAPRRWRSTGSIRAMSASRPSAIRSFRR
jgi:hypothetical protein